MDRAIVHHRSPCTHTVHSHLGAIWKWEETEEPWGEHARQHKNIAKYLKWKYLEVTFYLYSHIYILHLYSGISYYKITINQRLLALVNKCSFHVVTVLILLANNFAYYVKEMLKILRNKTSQAWNWYRNMSNRLILYLAYCNLIIGNTKYISYYILYIYIQYLVAKHL